MLQILMLRAICAAAAVASAGQQMSYYKELVGESFWDTWNLVLNRSVVSAMIGLGIYFSTLLLLKCRRKHEEAKNRLKERFEAAVVTACVFLIIWAVNFLVFTPKRMIEEERRGNDRKLGDKDGEIDRLKKENKRLEDNNKLADLIERQIALSKKGSLSSRASILAREILQWEADRRSEEQRAWQESIASQPKDLTDKAAIDEWGRNNSAKYQAVFVEENRKFNQALVPRILVIIDDLKANGLTDSGLDQWAKHPHYAGQALTEAAVAISKLAIRMEEKENGVTPP
jgi:hypothetical protein